MAIPLLFLAGAGLLGATAGAYTALNKPKKTSTPTPSPTPAPVKTTPKKTTPAPSYDPYASQMAAYDREIAQLRAQIEAMPKLPTYNTTEAWARAQKTATKAVNPVYQDKLNNQLNIYKAKKTQKTTEVTRGKEDLDTQQRYLMEDIGTDKVRTEQDTASKIAESLYQEGQFQDAEGTAFDRANRQARSELATAGLTTSGLGQQALEEQVLERNIASADQVRSFENQRATQELLKTRTFEDLDTKGTRGQELTTRQKQDLDIELNNFITNLGLEETQFRHNLEAERLGAVFDATQNAYNTDIRNWLAGLSGQGWRSQDIALAYQVYG